MSTVSAEKAVSKAYLVVSAMQERLDAGGSVPDLESALDKVAGYLLEAEDLLEVHNSQEE